LLEISKNRSRRGVDVETPWYKKPHHGTTKSEKRPLLFCQWQAEDSPILASRELDVEPTSKPNAHYTKKQEAPVNLRTQKLLIFLKFNSNTVLVSGETTSDRVLGRVIAEPQF
jgi:hypothetical protein